MSLYNTTLEPITILLYYIYGYFSNGAKYKSSTNIFYFDNYYIEEIIVPYTAFIACDYVCYDNTRNEFGGTGILYIIKQSNDRGLDTRSLASDYVINYLNILSTYFKDNITTSSLPLEI